MSERSPTLETRQPRSTWALFEGGSLLMLGMLALALPFVSPFAWPQTLGVVLVSAGAVGIVSGLTMHPALGLRWQLMSALLAAVAGALLLWLSRTSALTPVRGSAIALFFVLGHGMVSLCYAFAHRRERGWSWMLVAALGEIALSALLIRSLAALKDPEVAHLLPVFDAVDSRVLTRLLPAIALTWDGLMLVMMGRTSPHKTLPEALPSPTAT